MPDAYENIIAYERDFHRMQSLSPTTPGEHESFFNCSSNDHVKMTSPGSMSPSSTAFVNMDTCDSLGKSQVFGIIGNTMESDVEIRMCGRTEIKILVQPVDKFRFRYKSEMMGTHGSLFGEKDDTSSKKEVPTVQLVNCPIKNAVIRCTLVTVENRRFPHAHHLVKKNLSGDNDDPHDIEVSDENNFIAMFGNMGIIHTAKKNIKDEIFRKRKIEVLEEKRRTNPSNAIITTRENLQLKLEAEKAQKWMNLNSVALCFQGFFYGENNVLLPLTEKVYSRPINNLKSALTGELKICRIDKHTCCCEGNEEVWLLVEKVGKKNIKVKFYELDDRDNIIWDADGRFSELDVHHQYAIVFKTPPYKDTKITSSKEVFIRLERPSDGEISNSLRFIYKPSDKSLYKKRPRLTSTSENIQSIQNIPNPSLEKCLSMGETFINLDNNISNFSGELKELFSDNNYCDSEEYKEYFNDLTNIENYLNLLNSTTSPCMNSDLVTDGDDLTEFEVERTDFAKDVLQKSIAILKDAEKISKASAIAKVRDLLQETTNYGDTALHFALRHERYEISKFIIMILSADASLKSIVNIQNSSGKTPLHLAVLQNQPDIVRALLKLGANPNLCDEDDANSLHRAVIVNALGCIEELLRSNVNLEVFTESGWSAVHLAAKSGSLQALHVLVTAGADINSTDMSYGRTALHIAVDSNHKHIVNYLLTKTKIDVNMKNFGGNTALHSAVVKGGKCAEELIKILKKHGADPGIRNNNIKEDEDENASRPNVKTELDIPELQIIKCEYSDVEDEDQRCGESSYDLARHDTKLMQLLRNTKVEYDETSEDDFVLKQKSEDDEEEVKVVFVSSSAVIQNHTEPASIATSASSARQQQQQQQQQQLAGNSRHVEDKLTDEHVNRIKHILDRTGGWERLAQHTNHGSLVRLYRKTKSPTSALFVKIRLQQPDITVRQVKKFLIDVQAFEAASALEKN